MRGVGLEVGAVAVFCRLWFALLVFDLRESGEREGKAYLVKIVVLSNELLKLRLDVHNLGCGEIELDDRNARFLEMLEEAHFRGLQEQKAATLAFFATSGTADTVNVVTGVVWGVELDDPVDSGDLRLSVSKLK